ncbi:MAG: glycosyltransferase [Cytophagales bacterium]|nr:glycosyltransferase [Armatimonadota bacterium]
MDFAAPPLSLIDGSLPQIALTVLVAGMGLIVVGSVAYLLLLLIAAARAVVVPGVAPVSSDATLPRMVVVIPAHNEALVLGATLSSLAAQHYPRERFRTVVVADNCTDTTATVAREAGVIVLERDSESERGKGHALRWAFAKLLARYGHAADVYVIVDADTWVAPDFLRVIGPRAMASADDKGRAAVQGRYGVLNSSDGWRAALMGAAFELYNHVRPLGASRLGLSVSLKGNGMAFTRPVVEEVGWHGRSITEDVDYGLDLLRAGITPTYEPRAVVQAQMPITAGQAASQRRRWETGRLKLLRDRALPLLGEALRRRSLLLADAALNLMLPPLAELVGALVLWGALIALTIGVSEGGFRVHFEDGAARFWTIAFLATAAGMAGYIVGGLKVSGAPRAAYQALLRAPLYALWKIALVAQSAVRRQNGGEWVRTTRFVTAQNAAVPGGVTPAPGRRAGERPE